MVEKEEPQVWKVVQVAQLCQSDYLHAWVPPPQCLCHIVADSSIRLLVLSHASAGKLFWDVAKPRAISHDEGIKSL